MANFNGKYLEIKSWATFGLVLIESSNVDALIGVGNMVAQEFQVSRILVKYRKKKYEKSSRWRFQCKYLETENLSHFETSASWKILTCTL